MLHFLKGRIARSLVAVAITLLFVLPAAVPVRAGTTGVISGTVTDVTTHVGIANVDVALVSASESTHTKTDGKGFFSFAGLPVDTYSASFTYAGYQQTVLSGVTVNADQSQSVNVTLSKAIQEIGRARSRSANSAFQPKVTTDTTTVTASQINTQLGKANNINESALLVSLPGASLDNSGYPVLRGGRENEEGFQFEGIDYVDAFTTQFTNSLRLNGVSSLQLTPGAGDASQGNAGTGVINLTAKQGTRPAFGTLDLEAVAYPFLHQFGLEYGFATPNGRFSNYATTQNTRENRITGPIGSDRIQQGNFYSFKLAEGNDFVDNMIYRFGKDNNQSLQLFYENVIVRFLRNGSFENDGLQYKTNDPLSLAQFGSFSGLTSKAQIQSIIGLDPQQDAVVEGARASAQYQPDYTTKIQYSNNLNSSTYFTAKYYVVTSVAGVNIPQSGAGDTGFADRVSLQGGGRAGFAVDLTKQLNSKNLLQIGGKAEKLHPIFDYQSNDSGFYSLSGAGFNGPGYGYELLDFLPPGGGPSACPVKNACGYLTQFAAQFPGGVVPRVPLYNQITPADEFVRSVYIRDQFTPTDRLKLDLGLRLDTASYTFPTTYANSAFNYDSKATKPSIIQPRAGFSYQFGRNDAIRGQYGRSIEIAPLADQENPSNRAQFSQYDNIASFDNQTGKVATFCGPTGKQRSCLNYGDQLFWENQNALGGPAFTPIKPETFNNFDASYSHQFPHDVAVKITPYYRRGYDAAALVATFKFDAAGNPILNPVNAVPLQNPATATNLGTNRTTGVEFQLTKEAAYGFSGSLSATYINEFSNVVPLSGSEDFFPSIPLASLALGNQYRVGFVSPFQATAAISYRTRSGFRINPIISVNKGYPIGAGLNAATFVNSKAVNVPNTNITSPGGSSVTSQFVDPANPGSLLNPNIAATRGTPEASSAGGVLSAARANTNISFEYSRPQSQTTVGLLISNLFGQVYSQPAINSRYQVVNTGNGGPISGLNATAVNFPGVGLFNYDAGQRGLSPYRLVPLGTPLNARFYYQLKF